MNGELPLIAVGGSGAVMLAGIHIYERRRDTAMRASRTRWRTLFPAGLEPLRAFAAVDGLAGLPPTVELIAETVAGGGRIEHFLLIPEAVRASVIATLTGVLGSLDVTPAPELPREYVTLSCRIFVPTPFVASTGQVAEASRGLLSGLAGLQASEQVVIRWALSAGGGKSWQSPTNPDVRHDRELERAWRKKLSGSTFAAAGLVLVKAGSMPRARELARHVEHVIRSRQSLGGSLRFTVGRGDRRLDALPRIRGSSGTLSAAELLGFLSWPLGAEPIAGVQVGASRTLLVPGEVPRRGIRLFVGQDAYGEREIAHSAESATHHTITIGASGTGKSTLLAGSILSAIDQGFGGIVIDPKADLVEAVLQRVSPEKAGQVVVLDAGDRSRLIPGIAVMDGGDPDLRADVLSGAIRSAFPADAWGVRSSFYVRLALRTLETSGSLLDVGRLFFDEAYLRTAVARLDDPYLVAAWQTYLGLSAGARAEHVQAPMNRIMALLSRPQIRAVIAARDPKLDIARLFAQRKFLLVNLAPGQLGEAGAALLGSIIMYAAWSAIEARISLPPEQRHPLLLFVDELASLLHGTPFSFELLAERARGLGAGLFVSIQTLGRIAEPVRGALLGNAASLIAFRSSQEPALIARQLPGLGEADIAGLPRFGVAARLGTGIGSSIAVVTGRTLPLPPPTGMAALIRDASAERYCSPPEPQIPPDPPSDESALGRGRRQA